MSRLNPLDLLLEIDAAGSLSITAARLGKTVSAISKMLTALEQQLGCALVDRQARPLRLTDAGLVYLDAARRIRDALGETEDRLATERGHPSGRLRITTSVLFGTAALAHYVHTFHQRFPDVKVEVSLSDDYVDLARTDFDLAIRHEQRGGGQWIARPLCDNSAWLCASPDYLARAGMPEHPDNLDQHAMLVYHYPSLDTRWVLTHAGEQRLIEPRAALESDSNDFLITLALAGDGVLACPGWSVAHHVRNGRLRRCLSQWHFSSESYGDDQLWAVYPSSSRGTAKVQQFIDGLRDHLAQVLR
ncbi:LysR family transcriptional regulator [Chitinimonas sp. BJYL2]|uniref:LysR family transcriptional regulator n=1 Tax=Chitinimonas sp. BJYL2 TaxID=2976696 RepID=UPI0022B4B348|nr:LysR family transcriptional regulator [Chitinimonas sp. BJYL2]